MYFNTFETSKTKLILTQNSTTTTTPDMLILIFKYKNYVNNRFNELIPHEIGLWCCKMGILEVCQKTPISPYV
jgi:hypothetical protein